MKNIKLISRSFFTFAAMVLLLAANCFAQDAAAKVDEFVKSEMQKQRIPGVSLAVVKNGQIVLAKGYGLANVELNVPVKPETVFQSGSVGKQFTATAVMMLVEAGKINLDDKITKYFTDAPQTWKNITVRNLLTHTSGLGDYPEDFDFRRDYTEDDLYKIIKAVPLDFQPGEKWQYSNLGYVTLGILIHKTSGEFYGDFLRERIFKLLGMTTARIISEADIVLNRAAGYQIVNGELKNQNWVAPSLNTTADGALYLTTLDMAKWNAALDTEKLLKKSSFDEMWSPVKLNDGKTHPYGFGWELGEINGHQIIEHGGSWQGFKSFNARFPDENLAVIIFANLAHTNTTRLAHGVAGIYNAELVPPPVATIEDKEPKVTEFFKDTLKKFIDGTVKPEIFTDEMRAAIFPDVAKQLGETFKSFGKIESAALVSRTEKNDFRIYRYLLKYPAVNIFITMTLTKDEKIARMGLNDEN